MRHEKTVSVSKIRLLWEPWEEDETPRNECTRVGYGTMGGFVMVNKEITKSNNE